MRNKLGRRDFVKMAGTGAVGLATRHLWAQDERPATKPNLIVIVADDLGYHDVGYHGCPDISTPNIDSIAQTGCRFTDGHVSCPVCSPTRAGLMTGRYQQRFGHEFNTGPEAAQPSGTHIGLPLTQITLAEVLKQAGYVTGVVGKWHLGMAEQFHPSKRGFDEFFGFLHGGHSYIDPGVGTWNPILRGTEEVAEQDYLTDAFGREAVAFIERHKTEPFFLYLAFNAVHTPLQAPEERTAPFTVIANPKRRIYAGMLTAMDDAIGQVLRKLHETGLENNTLVVFLSDNGGPTQANGSDNTPLRGGKGTMYEGGHRVPFCMKWPGHIERGSIYDQPIVALDIFPTMVAAAGAVVPDDRPLDGVNLIPYLIGENEGAPHEVLFWRSGQNYACRQGHWKLVRFGDQPAELYDLAVDIGENNNLAEKQPQVVEQLTDAIAEWEKEMIAPAWSPPQRNRANRRRQARNRPLRQPTSQED